MFLLAVCNIRIKRIVDLLCIISLHPYIEGGENVFDIMIKLIYNPFELGCAEKKISKVGLLGMLREQLRIMHLGQNPINYEGAEFLRQQIYHIREEIETRHCLPS